MRRLMVVAAVAAAVSGCGGGAAAPGVEASAPVAVQASAPVVEASVPAAPAPVAAVAPAPPAEPVSAWTYDEKKDEMRGKTRYLASLTSTNEIQLDFPYNGGSSMQLVLRDDPEYGKDVMLMISKGQLPCYTYDGCSFKVKFDDGPVRDISAAGAESGSSEVLFVQGAGGRKRLMEGLRSAKRMIVEVTVYDAGRQQFVFEPAGLNWNRF